jgi:hypothetical protein
VTAEYSAPSTANANPRTARSPLETGTDMRVPSQRRAEVAWS